MTVPVSYIIEITKAFKFIMHCALCKIRSKKSWLQKGCKRSRKSIGKKIKRSVNSLRLLSVSENTIIGSESTICKVVGERKQSALFSTCSFCIENCEIRILNAISPTLLHEYVNKRDTDVLISKFKIVIQNLSTRVETQTLYHRWIGRVYLFATPWLIFITCRMTMLTNQGVGVLKTVNVKFWVPTLCLIPL